MKNPIQYVIVKNGSATCPIPDCELTVEVRIDQHKSLVRTGGCDHIISPGFSSVDGVITVGFADHVAA